LDLGFGIWDFGFWISTPIRQEVKAETRPVGRVTLDFGFGIATPIRQGPKAETPRQRPDP
jgi:hypothetical protein